MTRIALVALSLPFAAAAMAQAAPDFPEAPEPPETPEVCERDAFRNHGQWVTCLVHEEGLRGRELAARIGAERGERPEPKAKAPKARR